MNVNANQVKSVTLCEREVSEGIAKECNVCSYEWNSEGDGVQKREREAKLRSSIRRH